MRALNNPIEFKRTVALVDLALLIVCVRTRWKESMSKGCGYAMKNLVIAEYFPLSLKFSGHGMAAYQEDRVQVIVKVPFLSWAGSLP